MASSKYATMNDVQAHLDDITIAEIRDKLQPLAELAGEAEDARQEALDAVSEAISYHDERQWEDRNSALETAIDRMNDYVEKLESLTAEISDIDGIAPAPSMLEELSNTKSNLEDLL